MLAEDIKITDINPFHYERLTSAIKHNRTGKQPVPTLIIFYRENQLVHAVHSVKGPVENVNFRGADNLEILAREHNVRRVVCVETGAIQRIATTAQSKMSHHQTMWEQILVCRAAFKDEYRAGIHIYPDPFKALPSIPDFAVRLFKRFLPSRMLIVMAVMDGDSIWTSLITGIHGGEVTLISTVDAREDLNLSGLDMPEKAALVLREVEQAHGAPTAGFFMDRIAFEQLAGSPRPLSSIARLAARKWIYVHPLPGRLRLIMTLAQFLNI